MGRRAPSRLPRPHQVTDLLELGASEPGVGACPRIVELQADLRSLGRPSLHVQGLSQPKQAPTVGAAPFGWTGDVTP